MTRYRLSGTVDEAHLSVVIGAYTEAGLRGEFDPEITLSLMSKFNAPSPNPDPVSRDYPLVTAKLSKVRRPARGNGEGADWPKKGSIYDVVLQALQGAPRSPADLREALKDSSFSAGSLNSALGRLEKAGKAKRGDGGWIAA